jgi:hypothetical protein
MDVPVVFIPVILSLVSDSAFNLLVYLVLRATGTENLVSNTCVVKYHTLTHGAETFLRSCSYSRAFQHFMEPEGSLPCSQEPSTSAKSIQSILSHYISLRSILILFKHLRLGLPSGIYPSRFPTNILYALLFSHTRATSPTHLILLT